MDTDSHDAITLELYQSTTKNNGSGGTGGNATVTISVLKNTYNQVSACTQENKFACRIGSTLTLTVNTWGTPSISVNEVAQEYMSVREGSLGNGNKDYTYQFTISGDTTVTGYVFNDNDGSVTYVCDGIVSAVALADDTQTDDSGNVCLQTVALSDSNGWTQTFTDLPLSAALEDGTREDYYYYFKEVNVPDGYSVSHSNGSSGVQEGTITVTNQKQRPVTSATVRKVWQDVNGGTIEETSEALPPSIEVYLLRTKGEMTERVDASGNTGEAAQPFTLTKEGGWTLTVGNLPTGYTYSFEEVAIEGYTSTVTTDEATGAVLLTNRVTPDETDLTVVKQWKDSSGNPLTSGLPGSVTINLYQRATQGGGSGGGESGGSSGKYASFGMVIKLGDYQEYRTTVNQVNDVSKPVGTTVKFSITDLWWNNDDKRSPQLKLKNGELLQANSTESNEYEPYQGMTAIKKTFYYELTLTGDTTISGYVGSWNSSDWVFSEITYKEPSSAPVEPSDPSDSSSTLYGSVTLTATNNWSHTFTGLPTTGVVDGSAVNYTYYVEEVSVSGFVTAYDNNDGVTSGTIYVTNTKNTTETPSYELPETGASGTSLFTMGGAALAAVSLLFGTRQRRRGERGVRH